MTQPKRARRKRNALIALAVAAVGGTGIGYKVNEYAADPVGEKDCPPLDATQADQPKTIDITTLIRQPGTITEQDLPWSQKGGTINDASCLNRTPVFGIVRVVTEDDIRQALIFARERGLKIAVWGVRHSMGGQAFARGALVLDMRGFNRIALDDSARTIRVQSGATWHDIQNKIHPKYAVKAMQSTDIFTVGGSISVNAHGMDHQVGAMMGTIRSMRVLLPDGTLQQVSRSENSELFNLVVGGYGLFGIILDVELDITDNKIYQSSRAIIDYQEFPDYFNTSINPDASLGLMYSHLSTSPDSFLREMILYKYQEVDVTDAEIPALGEVSSTKLRRFVINFSKRGDMAMRVKWFAEKYIEPRMESCSINRNQAMKDGEACLVSRNEPMHDSVAYLRNNLRDTDILHEYFIPRARFTEFVDKMRMILEDHNANLLNASVRIVHPERNMLTYAPDERFSLVLYINQGLTPEDNQKMRAVTSQLIDLAVSVDGTFFLPYQLHYTPEQLQQAYPQIGDFFAAKRRYDPDELLTSVWYERYSPSFLQ